MANGTERVGLGMLRRHSVVSLVVLATLDMTRIAGSPDALIRNAGDLSVPTEMVMIVRVGCLNILARIVVFLVVIPGVVVEFWMTTDQIPMPIPMTKNRNGTIESLMRSGEASFSSQVIGFGERGRTGRKAI